MPFRAFLDANVLVPARERDVLLTLAEAGLFEARWSHAVLDEMQRHLPTHMSKSMTSHLLDQMARAFPEATVLDVRGVAVVVPDEVNTKDRHVVASAILGRCDVLVTEDAALRTQLETSIGLDAQTFGVFVAYAIDADPYVAGAALEDMVRRRWLRDEPVTGTEIRTRWAAWAEPRHGAALSAIRW